MEENKNDALNIFNGPLPTTQEQPVEEVTPVVDNEVVTSGTATEEEIVVDATKPMNEVLDEDEIKKDVREEKEKTKSGVLFIIVIIAIIVAFILVLPKLLGL